MSLFRKNAEYSVDEIELIRKYRYFNANPNESLWGSITEADEEGIRRAVELSSKYEGSIVEIGSLFGHSTNFISTLKDQERNLIAVENFQWNPFGLSSDQHRKMTLRTLRYVIDHCNVELFDGDSEIFYQDNKKRIAMVFIDAGHDYESVSKDIKWAKSVGCPVICGHDYTENHEGVVKAVDEQFGKDFELYGSVWVVRQ